MYHRVAPLWDHPRSRGEQCRKYTENFSRMGSPPLARGAATTFFRDKSNGRITPARAGSSGFPFHPSKLHWDHPARAGSRLHHHAGLFHTEDHPRSRGEQSTDAPPASPPGGSPPLARGAGIMHATLWCSSRITPARAGSRPPAPRASGSGRDHPRSRGEQTPRTTSRFMPSGSPPLARGAA